MSENLHAKSKERIRKHRGIEEDVYAPEFKPDTSLSKQLNLGDKEIIVTVRPPAMEIHYHNPRKRKVFHRVHGTGDGDARGEVGFAAAQQSAGIAHPRQLAEVV
ncbi:hypothetical protein [Bradyrhizobium valentinum]|uniref:hypothetical protein n=1 Tax=Bradyrhizobium valentinum TaxID=1518501 RepID=UPI0018D240E5|nr:hypothetical protein [Bradyrhizobium valentinum]